MKVILGVFAAAFFLADTASAIPQTFSGVNGFANAVGMAFEQYAASADPWAPGAELKGPWKPRDGKAPKAGGLETLDLAVDATVFGIAAAQVSAERVAGVVRCFTVRFDEAKLKNGKTRAGGLYELVLANLTALAGEAKPVASGGKTFRYESSLITARKAGGKEVIVEFTPAK